MQKYNKNSGYLSARTPNYFTGMQRLSSVNSTPSTSAFHSAFLKMLIGVTPTVNTSRTVVRAWMRAIADATRVGLLSALGVEHLEDLFADYINALYVEYPEFAAETIQQFNILNVK